MNYALAQLVEEGVDVMQAVKMASLYPARAYGLTDRGAIAEGYRADMVIIEDTKDFKARNVIANGKLVEKTYKRCRFPREVMKSIRRRPITEEDITIALSEELKAAGRVKAHILEIVDGTLETLHEERELPVVNGKLQLEDDLMYCAVIDRYKKDGSIGIGIISKAGHLKGAFAGSIAQDTQNLIVFGDNIPDMVKALNQVIRKQGGMSYVKDGRKEQFVGLPVLGILSQEPIAVFAEETRILAERLSENGCTLKNPILTMSLQIPLAVIPEMAITNRGLLDIVNHRFIPVCEPV